jgi:hypothetical protein
MKEEGRRKNGGWWILNFEFWMVDWGTMSPWPAAGN